MCTQGLQVTVLHIGNGTSDIFEDDPSVLFVSTHQQGIYPFVGKVSEVGKGDGEGATMHIPLPGTSIGCSPCACIRLSNIAR